jgi:hypothetical protein
MLVYQSIESLEGLFNWFTIVNSESDTHCDAS